MTTGHDLVFALCHEVGNLVGAIRLNADLIDAEASAVELANASVEIDDSSARIRSWLSLVRPLLDGEAGPEPGVPPAALLAGIDEALDEYGGHGVEIDVQQPDGLARVRGRSETLHHLIVTLAVHAVEETRPSGRVQVNASSGTDGLVVFCVEDDGPGDDSLQGGAGGLQGGAGGALTGRALAVASANLILGRVGGAADVARVDGCTRVSLRLPPL